MTLATPHATLEVVRKFSLRLDKSLGQHFLVDQNILNKIVDAASLDVDDVVLEVGPGIGTLTQALAARAGRVISLELDRRLEPVLAHTLRDFTNVDIVFLDALKADLRHLPGDLPVPSKLVANLPYQVATPIIADYLDAFEELRLYVVMIQKEVADRIAAKPATPEYGAFSVKAQFYCDITKVATISRNVFIPPPEVSSAVVRMERRDVPRAAVADRDLFFAVVRGAFGQRRKTVKNALAGGEHLGFDAETIGAALAAAGIDPRRRGETLSVAEFARIADALYAETAG